MQDKIFLFWKVNLFLDMVLTNWVAFLTVKLSYLSQQTFLLCDEYLEVQLCLKFALFVIWPRLLLTILIIFYALSIFPVLMHLFLNSFHCFSSCLSWIVLNLIIFFIRTAIIRLGSSYFGYRYDPYDIIFV